VADFSVRDAELRDARAIAYVQTCTWQVAYAHIFPGDRLTAISDEPRAEWWRQTISDRASRTHTLVVDDAAEVAGFASLGPAREDGPDRQDLGELYAIYVRPDGWGRGLGQALMAEAMSRFRSDGFLEAILWVLEDNPRTRLFYEQAGWRFDGGVKEEEILATRVREVRYRIALEPTT